MLNKRPISRVQYLRQKFEAVALDSSEWFNDELSVIIISSASSPTSPTSPVSNESFEFQSTSTTNRSSSIRWSSVGDINLVDNVLELSEDNKYVDEEINKVLLEEIKINENIVEVEEIFEANQFLLDDNNYDDSFDDDSSVYDDVDISRVISKCDIYITKIIKELLSSEEAYVKSLRNGIKNYVTIMDLSYVPHSLKGHKYTIFSTIEKLYDFHNNILLPQLRDCKEDVEKICEIFREMIKNDHFYPYVQYAMNKPRSEAIALRNQKFFEERQSQIHERLGVNSFLMHPIQRICKYSLIFCNIIQELGKEYTKNKQLKDKLALCCKTERNIQKLLDTTNEAITINDIEYDEHSNDINFLHQGKFYKGADFDISAPKYKTKKFKGRLFIFERLLVYTEYNPNDNKKLYYRGSFKRENVGIRIDGKKCFYLSSTMQKYDEIRFNGSLATETVNYIRNILMKVVEEEKIKLYRKISYRLIERPKSIRKNDTNKRSSNRGSSNNRDSYEICNTSWDQRKIFENIRNSEKNYIQLLKTNKKYWVENLEINIKKNIEEYTNVIDTIYDFHKTIFYPALIECGSDYQAVINLFKTHLNNSFKNYILYSSVATYIFNEIQKYHLLPVPTTIINSQEFIRLPIKRISDYLTMIDVFVQDLQIDPLTSNAFNQAAILQVQFYSFNKIFYENYKLYSIKQTLIDLREYGNVLYSDLISIDGPTNLIFDHRIFLMDSGILCVKVKDRLKTKYEFFIEIISNIFYSMKIKIRGSLKQPNRIDFDTDTVRSIISGITFRTLEKRQIFCDRLLILSIR